MAGGLEFDASEMSGTEYVAQMASGDWPFVAIPVFASRVFRRSFIVINRKTGIKKPQDLEGRREVVQLHTMSAATWIRGLLHHDLSTINWVQGAVLSAMMPEPFWRSSDVVRLFPNFREVEADYFKRTGIFPFMHLIVIRRDVYAKYPDVAFSLYQEFCKAK